MSDVNEVVRQFMPWSISKADLAKKCPRAFKYKYVDRIRTASGTEARVGTAAHRSTELQRQGVQAVEAEETAIREAKDLTVDELEDLASLRLNIDAYVRRIEGYKQRHGNIIFEGQEIRTAIDLKGQLTGYDSPDAFMRGSIDDSLEHETGLTLIVDHKFGKLKAAADYDPQLKTYTVLYAAARPSARELHSGIHFGRFEFLDWHKRYPADYARKVLTPWLKSYVEAAAAGLGTFEPKPQRLCPWCDYFDRCAEGQAFCKEKGYKRTKKKKPAPRKPAELPVVYDE